MVVRQDEPGRGAVARGADQDRPIWLRRRRGEWERRSVVMRTGQFRHPPVPGAGKAITPGRAGGAGERGWRRRGRAPGHRFTGAGHARRRGLPGRAGGEGFRVAGAETVEVGAVPGAYGRGGPGGFAHRRMLATARPKAVARPPAARSTQSWSRRSSNSRRRADPLPGVAPQRQVSAPQRAGCPVGAVGPQLVEGRGSLYGGASGLPLMGEGDGAARHRGAIERRPGAYDQPGGRHSASSEEERLERASGQAPGCAPPPVQALGALGPKRTGPARAPVPARPAPDHDLDRSRPPPAGRERRSIQGDRDRDEDAEIGPRELFCVRSSSGLQEVCLRQRYMSEVVCLGDLAVSPKHARTDAWPPIRKRMPGFDGHCTTKREVTSRISKTRRQVQEMPRVMRIAVAL